MNIEPDRLVNSAQALIGYYPAPTSERIDDVLARMCKAFDIPFTVESDAKLLWRQRIAHTVAMRRTNHARQAI
jgi:hypothetical protein